MTDAEKIDFLGGQVKVLSHFLVALINTHPDFRDLQIQYAAAKQVGLGKIEAELVPEVYLDGMRDVYGQLDLAFSSRAARP